MSGCGQTGCGCLVHGALKTAISLELIDELSWIFSMEANWGKWNVTLIILRWARSKMGMAF